MKSDRKYAVVFGASQRLGRAIALYLAQNSYHVAIHYKDDAAGAHKTLRMLQEYDDGSFIFHGDITCVDRIDEMLEKVLSVFDRIDVVVNCISVFNTAMIDEVDEMRFDADQAVHQRGPFFLTRALFSLAKQNNSQVALVHLTDAHTIHPKASRPSYYTAKSALEAQIRTLAVSVAPFVRINGVAPGLVIPNSEQEALYFSKREQQIPLYSLPSPSDVAHAVLFLAENKSITGQTIIVDGGEWLL